MEYPLLRLCIGYVLFHMVTTDSYSNEDSFYTRFMHTKTYLSIFIIQLVFMVVFTLQTGLFIAGRWVLSSWNVSEFCLNYYSITTQMKYNVNIIIEIEALCSLHKT